MAKTLIAKYFLEKTSFSNCDLWSLQNQNFWKQQNLSYLSHKVKKHLTGALENTIFREADVYLKLPQHNFFLKSCRSQTVIFEVYIPENNRISYCTKNEVFH